MKRVYEKLAVLGYHRLWLDAGFINGVFLDHQFRLFDEGVDFHKEHYRYAAFLAWMDDRKVFSDAEIDDFMALIRYDEDECMAESAALRLLENIHLSDQQFNALYGFLADFSQGSCSRILLRLKFLRHLKQSQVISDHEFSDCLIQGDAVVHEYILENFAQNSVEYLTQLADKGGNRRVRNMAGARLKMLLRMLAKANKANKPLQVDQ